MASLGLSYLLDSDSDDPSVVPESPPSLLSIPEPSIPELRVRGVARGRPRGRGRGGTTTPTPTPARGGRDRGRGKGRGRGRGRGQEQEQEQNSE
jgi:hypothetical protein